MNALSTIQRHPEPHCYLCGAKGKPLYKNLTDQLFGTEGEWNLDTCSNSECQLTWLNPMPNQEELSKLYRNYYTHKNSEHSHNWFRALIHHSFDSYYKEKYGYPTISSTILHKLLAKLITCHPEWKANLDGDIFYLPYKQGGKILDVGCGNGTTLEKMTRLGWYSIGIDFDANSIKVAQQRNLDARHGDIDQQGFKSEEFDAIIMSHVIEHLPDPLDMLKKCLELLKPSGKLIITTPNINGYAGRVYKNHARHLEPPRHLYLFRKNNLHNLAEKAGFHEIQVTTSIRHFRGMWIESQKLKSNTFPIKNIVPSFLSIIFGFALKLKIGEGDELTLIASKQ